MKETQERLRSFLREQGACHQEFAHPPCKSSEESARARKEAGAGATVGAKALVLKKRDGSFAICVLPGPSRLDGKSLRQIVGRYRFANAEEMLQVTGLEPGMVPPFGPQLFPEIAQLVVDPELEKVSALGFNMACFTASIVMEGAEYFRIIQHGGTIIAGISHLEG